MITGARARGAAPMTSTLSSGIAGACPTSTCTQRSAICAGLVSDTGFCRFLVP